MMQQLNLSSEQQALHSEARASFQPKAQQIRAQMQALQEQRAELLQAGDFNGLHRLIDKQAKLKAKLQHQRLRSMEDFHQSLSPDQLEPCSRSSPRKRPRPDEEDLVVREREPAEQAHEGTLAVRFLRVTLAGTNRPCTTCLSSTTTEGSATCSRSTSRVVV